MITKYVSRSCATLGLAASIVLFAWQAPAAVIPQDLSDLAVGSPYQVIFLTHDTTTATNTDIGYYNNFVRQEASLSSTLPTDATWNAIASTSTVDARTNVSTSSDVPIYSASGDLVAISGDALWQTGFSSLQLANSVMTDQYGSQWVMDAWTGSNSDGTKASMALGQWSLPGATPVKGPEIGCGVFQNSRWLDLEPFSSNLSGGATQALSLYALSSVVTVPATVPEPSAFALLAVGLLAIFGRRRLAKG
jgi:hypothetical protein